MRTIVHDVIGRAASRAAGKLASLPRDLTVAPLSDRSSESAKVPLLFSLGTEVLAFSFSGQNYPRMLCSPLGLSAESLSPLEAAGLWNSAHSSNQSHWARQGRLSVSPTHLPFVHLHSPNDSANLLCAHGSDHSGLPTAH